jgi:hypothetical protein
MQRTLTILFTTNVLIVTAVFSFFTLYAQFALDYSLENLKMALEATQKTLATTTESRFLRLGLESMAIEEISRRDGDIQTAVLLDDARRSLAASEDRANVQRAGIFLTEVLKKKSAQRHLLLRLADPLYYFLHDLFRSFRKITRYLKNRLYPPPEVLHPVRREAVSALILSEAERLERSWRLEGSERYYREFLNRFPDGVERGFVQIALAHILMKRQRFSEASEILKGVQKEFAGDQEEIQARGLVERLATIQKRLTKLIELEDWIRSAPDKLLSEEGGLELALGYLATYQIERSLAVLGKLSEAVDPRLRTKAFFYIGWIRQWQGNPQTALPTFKATA